MSLPRLTITSVGWCPPPPRHVRAGMGLGSLLLAEPSAQVPGPAATVGGAALLGGQDGAEVHTGHITPPKRCACVCVCVLLVLHRYT
jgi:hypothetical protein